MKPLELGLLQCWSISSWEEEITGMLSVRRRLSARPLGRNQTCQHLDHRIPAFRTVRNKCLLVKPPVCGALLRQFWKTNTSFTLNNASHWGSLDPAPDIPKRGNKLGLEVLGRNPSLGSEERACWPRPPHSCPPPEQNPRWLHGDTPGASWGQPWPHPCPQDAAHTCCPQFYWGSHWKVPVGAHHWAACGPQEPNQH